MHNVRQQNWWQRNWKWVVPTGCLGAIVAFFGFIAVIFLVVFSTLKSSWACTESLELARSNPEVIELLGEPIETGWFVGGNINTTGGSGNAELAFPIEGPKGSAMIFVEAQQQSGEWYFELAEVAVEGQQQRINLLTLSPPEG